MCIRDRFEDNSFPLVVFDPPHLFSAKETSWLVKKYGKLHDNWPQMLHDGFAECMLSLIHIYAVGRGRNRKDIIHKGMRVLPLCREMHTLAHNMGRDSFCEKYHIFGIKLDTYLCGIWKVRAE